MAFNLITSCPPRSYCERQLHSPRFSQHLKRFSSILVVGQVRRFAIYLVTPGSCAGDRSKTCSRLYPNLCNQSHLYFSFIRTDISPSGQGPSFLTTPSLITGTWCILSRLANPFPSSSSLRGCKQTGQLSSCTSTPLKVYLVTVFSILNKRLRILHLQTYLF